MFEFLNAVRAAMFLHLAKPLEIDANLTGRERDIAFEAERQFEPTTRYVFPTNSAMTKSIVIRDDIKAEIANTLQVVINRLVKSKTALPSSEPRHAMYKRRCRQLTLAPQRYGHR